MNQEEAESALLSLGAQLTWYESDDPVEVRGYTNSFDLYHIVSDQEFWVVIFNDFDYPSGFGIDYDHDFRAGIYCARKLASVAEAKAACERHYMTGRWLSVASGPGINQPGRYQECELQIPGDAPMFPPEPPPMPPPAVQLEWFSTPDESAFVAWAHDNNTYEVSAEGDGWNAAKDEHNPHYGWCGNLRCGTTFLFAADARTACEHHHATGKWE